VGASAGFTIAIIVNLHHPDSVESASKQVPAQDSEKPSADDQLAPFLSACKPYSGGTDEAMLAEIQRILVLRAPGVDEKEKDAILSLPSGRPDKQRLMTVESVQTLVVGFREHGQIDPYHFLNKAQRTQLNEKIGIEMVSPESCIQIKQDLARVGERFMALRKSSRLLDDTPSSTALPLMRWIEQARLARYDFPGLTNRPPIPLFSPAEVALVDRVYAYLNCPAAQAAFPSDVYRNLYLPGTNTCRSFPLAFKTYGSTVRSRLADELELVSRDYSGATTDKVRDAQRDLNRLLDAVAETCVSH
jgi:hypothetical protein